MTNHKQERFERAQMKNKNIAASIFFGLSIFVLFHGILLSFLDRDFKPKCVANGGVYSETLSSILIVSQTCTYSKVKIGNLF